MPDVVPASTALPARADFTWAGCREGMRATVPLLPGIAVFAMAFGGAAAQKGLTLAESVLMSLLVCAGASQMLSLELWRDLWTVGALVTTALVTATVNARFILMGASLQPWLAGASPVRQGTALAFFADGSWLIAERHRAAGGRDLGVLFGSAGLCWVVWVLCTAPGHLAGSLVTDPRRYALDLVMPFFFAAMSVPLWRGARVSAPPWAAAAGVGLAVQLLVPGYLFIVAGALAGAATGALRRARP